MKNKISYDTWILLENKTTLKLFDKLTGKNYLIEFEEEPKIKRVYTEIEEVKKQ